VQVIQLYDRDADQVARVLRLAAKLLETFDIAHDRTPYGQACDDLAHGRLPDKPPLWASPEEREEIAKALGAIAAEIVEQRKHY
jgi:hypothetical protein